MDYDAIVIGAGAGGLSAGGCLAAAGLKTLVLEQSGAVGGCASSFDRDGFRFDTGACIIEMARAHDWFYERLGLERGDYVTFIKNDPVTELVDPLNGKRHLIPASLEGTAEIIGRYSREDARTFLEFMRDKGKMLDEFVDVVFTTPQGRMRDLIKVFRRYPGILLNMKYLLTPYGKFLKDRFRHPFTRSLLTNHSAIGGLPPSLQSAMLLWDCYAEHDGMFYPQGGMGELTRGMARALKDVGGELRLGSRVDRIHTENGKASGVVLADGTVITSRVVVSNTSARRLYLEMIGEEKLPGAVVKGLKSYDFSPSCTVGYLGLDYRPPLKAQHIMALTSPEMIDRFWFCFYKRNIAIPQSVGLVTSPTYYDPSLAPEGCHSLTFMNMAPRHPRNGGWKDTKWDYLDQAIEMLNAVFLPGVKEHIILKTIATPEDFEERLLIPDGSLYGFSMSVWSQMVFRPGNRSRCVKDLYLCGASSHTGSVPGAVCSGMIAADLVLEDMNGRRHR